jgi:uncharacterized protein CbrC (UPF0167 family)
MHDSMQQDHTAVTVDVIVDTIGDTGPRTMYRVACPHCGEAWLFGTEDFTRYQAAKHAGEELDRRDREYAQSRTAAVVR